MTNATPPYPILPFNLMTNFEGLVNQLRCLVLSTSPSEIKQEERDRLAAALTHAGYGSHATFMGLSLPAWARGGCPMPSRAQSPLEAFEEFPGLRMMPIPAGTFLMGSPREERGRYGDEGPQHWVTLPAFFMGQTPVTQAQWRVVARLVPPLGQYWERELTPNPSHFGDQPDSDQRPVEQVSWHDAMEFCRRLNSRLPSSAGRTYSLPSEAQWEYACRAGTTTPFAFGETISPELANYDATVAYANGPKGVNRGETTPVGSFPANAWTIGMTPTPGPPPMAAPGCPMLVRMLPGCCAAALGTTILGTAARPTATGATRASTTPTGVSASVASPRTNSLHLNTSSTMPETPFDRAVAAMEQRYEAMTPLGDDWIHQCVAAVFEVVVEEFNDQLNAADLPPLPWQQLSSFVEELKQQASEYPLVPPKWEPPNA